jgi:predicted DNA-binding protein YlxM (UPF0122 family)
MKRTEISCEELVRLYLDEAISAPEIASQLGCSVGTIYTRLEECRIPTRSMSEAAILNRGIELSCDELHSLYLDQELTIYEIAGQYECSPVTIHRRLAKCGIAARPAGGDEFEYPKKDFDGTLLDKAYLLGFAKGDLHVDRGNWAIRVRCTSTKQEQFDLVQQLFANYGGIWISKMKLKRGKCITAHLNLSFDFLVSLKDEIPDWVLADDNMFASFWSGYLDAEGSFIISGKRAYFKVDSCDKNILFQAWRRLEWMGLEFSPPYIVRKKGTLSGLLTSRCDLWRLTTERKETLTALCALVEPFLKHAKRRADMWNVKMNVETRQAR